jgi:hypothetical protein
MTLAHFHRSLVTAEETRREEVKVAPFLLSASILLDQGLPHLWLHIVVTQFEQVLLCLSLIVLKRVFKYHYAFNN